MEAYIERMVEEKRELDERIAKLVEFRYSERADQLDDYQKNLMYRQFRAMAEYSDTLSLRIFNEKVKTGVITPSSPLSQNRGDCCVASRY